MYERSYVVQFSLLKASPALPDSVKFHRELLRVPLNTPFRQQTRLTVTVENIVQAGVLYSGNPVLKTYDLVAVKPLNQTASVFDHVCKASEVDLIAIDCSERLPFQLKLPMVKAAIEQGGKLLQMLSQQYAVEPLTSVMKFSVIFDFSESSNLFLSIHIYDRDFQLLLDWTRGENIIFTSGASSVNELKGPYDVASLSSLLGLSMERAKAATSKNFRALIARAFREKQFYKEAIRVGKNSILSTSRYKGALVG
ncbi:hypothetical protein C5167_003846 [Papaver somniferum]|uniref:Uncharacterized protein n=1 Tax=Papaver somniferum TaxID=3469 RepID=A0A4Y7L2F1_PAPSO|nr:hypothetical protein C5167_003846 [Papaver somniferum]